MEMEYTTHDIVYVHDGEISYTPRTPRMTLADAQARGVDLTEQVMRLYSSDDWRASPVALYEVRNVALPAWLDAGDWLTHLVRWQWLWAMHPQAETLPECQQRALLALQSTTERYAVLKLLTTAKFRSPFRASLRDQFCRWAETPADQRAYGSPYSTRQWEALLDNYTLAAAQSLDRALYHNVAYTGCSHTHTHAPVAVAV